MWRMWDESSDSDDGCSPGSDSYYRQFMLTMEIATREMQLREAGMGVDIPESPPMYHPARVRPSTSEGNPASSAPLSSLDAITIPELFLRKRHSGTVVYGKFCVEPVTTLSVNDIVTVLVDTSANSVRVITTKLLWHTAPTSFSLGKQVAIKEPSMEMCSDGMSALRVSSLAQVVSLDSVKADCNLPAESTDGTLLEELENIRAEGNRFSAKENWDAAVERYSKCINRALQKLNEGEPRTASEDKFDRILMLAYSNRAEDRLRLQHYEDALKDADEALKFDPKHVKTLVRKGRAAYKLGLFERSCISFKAALEESPGEQSIVASLAASTVALKQSRTGEYNLSEFFLSGGSMEPPSCADFIGPVEIGRVSYGHGRRGLFATRNIKAGEILLVSNPLAVSRQMIPDTTLLPMENLANLNNEVNLVSELAERVKTSKRLKAQLYSLCSRGRHEMEIPSMENFRPGSEWVPEDGEKFEESESDRIGEIVAMNGMIRETRNLRSPDGHILARGEAVGIWLLSSFANHSCSPNVIDVCIGDAFFFRASVDIVKGLELCISYIDESELLEGVDVRQAAIKRTRGFICNCSRCLLEETLQHKLLKTSNKFRCLRIEAGFEILYQLQLGEAGPAMKNMAILVDEVEVVIESSSSELGQRQQGWIRAQFHIAYLWKFRLALVKRDRSESLWNIILDSTLSVCLGPLALAQAAVLLKYVERWHPKSSQSYRLTLNRVLDIYRLYFGQQPKAILLKLIKDNQQKLSDGSFPF